MQGSRQPASRPNQLPPPALRSRATTARSRYAHPGNVAAVLCDVCSLFRASRQWVQAEALVSHLFSCARVLSSPAPSLLPPLSLLLEGSAAHSLLTRCCSCVQGRAQAGYGQQAGGYAGTQAKPGYAGYSGAQPQSAASQAAYAATAAAHASTSQAYGTSTTPAASGYQVRCVECSYRVRWRHVPVAALCRLQQASAEHEHLFSGCSRDVRRRSNRV